MTFNLSVSSGQFASKYKDSPIIILKNSDVRLVAISTGSNQIIGGTINGYLAKIIG